MKIQNIVVDVSKTKKINGYEFSSQKYGVSISYGDFEDNLSPADIESHVNHLNDFISDILNDRLELNYKKPTQPQQKPAIIDKDNDAKELYRAKTISESALKEYENPGPCTYKQVKCIHAKCKAAGISKEQLFDRIAVAYAVGNLEQLTIIEASEIISEISRANSIENL